MLGKHHHFLKKFSISDAAIAYKKPRSTILKYIKSGDFKLDYNNLIEYSELIRKFGEITSPIQDEREQQIKKLKDEVMYLKKQLNFFKYTSISNKNRLLISHKDSI
ncbi:Uncharacterised protein [Acinetobacter baumannii]|uniref:hypothetical protein n=1 Tax=Acinetobacter calcoaceticus/baumannii complex TaxID=909768 RepID=UPI00026E1DAB|nr:MULTISPECIES: hypothetical protein [Acinetobacter calcoaceticus/baumannii complex]EHU1786410.1 hypothetical protein [Acinetobacter baumannii]EHU1859615.1 hypothetical protein [Acinetobacter baumannii]EHU1958159.1 hypothetical protein [Acinetobacter baumannii]EHU2072354.1 hypothetical protein [Acinetobacter baumannii]EHU2185323.1 hypothetical protein [Acinetobacter baumannii]